ncbi:MAG: hypothetical protein R3C53_21910 [Pirellulaceae bacterium]
MTTQTAPLAISKSVSKIDVLVEHQADKSISIIMPTYEAGRPVKQNAIRFRNLLAEVIEELVRSGESQTQAEARVQPLVEIADDTYFWQHQKPGLAIYLADGNVIAVGLHESPAEAAIVGKHFYLTPVALDAADKKSCLVLSLSWEEAKLFSASRSEVIVEETDVFPIALRDVILPPDPEVQLQFRTQGAGDTGSAVFHGQGQGEDTIESDRKRFLSEVGKRLNGVLDQQRQPLILVATDEVAGEFLAATKLEPVGTIQASPDGLEAKDFTERVLESVNRISVSAASESMGEQLGNALAAKRASRELSEVLDAAAIGRVQILLVNSRLVKEAAAIEVATRQRANLAVIRTLQTRGELLAETSDVLGSDLVAAIYRY